MIIKRFLLSNEQVWVVLILIYCLFDLTRSITTAWPFTTDDAFISWGYAQELVNGNGLVWHPLLPRVEGYSNFLWVMIAALIISLKLPLITSIKIISCVSLGAGLFFLYRFGRLFFSPLMAILPVFIFSHYIGVTWWTMSGLESTFYCALSLLFVWQSALAFQYSEINGLGNTAAWAGANLSLLLVCLTRFEGIVWILPVLIFAYCRLSLLKKNGLVFPKEQLNRWVFISTLCFLLPYCLYFSWRVFYFGSWIPNSYRCKILTDHQLLVVDFEYLLIVLPVIILGIPYLLGLKDCKHWLLWLPSLAYGLMLFHADPVITYFLRLFLAPFALMCLLPVLGILEFLTYFNLKTNPKMITCGLIIPFTFLFIPGNNLDYLKQLTTHYQERTHNRWLIAQRLNRDASYGDTVLIGDCGYIPYLARSDIRFIDSQCLNNAEMTHPPFNHQLPLYARYIADKVKPDWLIITYYPIQGYGDRIVDLLKGEDFFKHYELITTLSSGLNTTKGDKPNVEVDYIYRVYRRLRD